MSVYDKFGNRTKVVTLNAIDFVTLVRLAIRGYNAEIKYKTMRRKGERVSERAMRRADERLTIERAQSLQITILEKLNEDPDASVRFCGYCDGAGCEACRGES